MSEHTSLVTPAAVVITALILVCQIFLTPSLALGEEIKWQDPVFRSAAAPSPMPRPAPPLNEKDAIVALERIQYALSEVGDGGTYAWRRWHGKLSGLVRPTASFKTDSGQVCRRLMVLLTSGKRTRKMHSVACRLPSGRWQLDG
jgi:hypothetical protein